MSARQLLALRRYRRNDRPAFRSLFADAGVMRYVGDGKPLDSTAADALLDKIFDYYRTDPAFFIWAIQEGAEYAGHAELKRRPSRSEYELIYMLQRSRWGRSLGTRVVDLILSEARKRSIPFVVATVLPENVASLSILRRRGFVPDPELSRELECAAYRLDLR